jgi:hypothetical protein
MPEQRNGTVDREPVQALALCRAPQLELRLARWHLQ